ncbi:MAG: hypothetical protein IKL59_03515 [Clostridia bacterium]|nr:hypothetical protein [Clostridia bacterium]
MLKKILALVLALIMITAVFVGCGKKKTPLGNDGTKDTTVGTTADNEVDDTDEDDSSNDDNTENEQTETKDLNFSADTNVEVDVTSPLDDLPIEELLKPENFPGTSIPDDRDYGGYTFNVLGDTNNYQREFVTESDGDIIKDALIDRQQHIEEFLNIDFVITETEGGYYNMDGYAAEIESASGAGTPYDLAISYNLIPPVVAAKGLSKDLAESENLNLVETDKEYWGKEIKKEIMIGGRIFWMSDNSSYNNIRNMLCIYANLDLFSKVNNLGKEDLYQMVKDGSWTFANMLILIQNSYENTNTEGDGNEGADDLDTFGLCTAATNPWVDNWLYAAGYRYTELNNKGTYQWTLDNQPLIDFIDWWQETIKTDDDIRIYDKLGGSQMFHGGRAMFYLSSVGLVESNPEIDCTVLPMPLYDSNVKNTYSTPFSNGYSSWLIPKATKTDAFERSATVLEELAGSANQYIAPRYFEIYLKRQFAASDDGMKEMFNLIRNSIVFDLGYLYGSSLTCENLGGGSGYSEVFIFLRRVWSNENSNYSNITTVWSQIKGTATTKLNNLMVDILDY